ncbi:hypothetical protein E2C01_038492 [Portunus trituberculatus]|uniref:Uncharacterized protein n=1 Tax=Portunus trituberculatus TaxID=210409 RepID=A0A5B7FEA9_PORTR|nr:hypothetical protein [Portunus trituberculatus]
MLRGGRHVCITYSSHIGKERMWGAGNAVLLEDKTLMLSFKKPRQRTRRGVNGERAALCNTVNSEAEVPQLLAKNSLCLRSLRYQFKGSTARLAAMRLPKCLHSGNAAPGETRALLGPRRADL